MSDLVVKFGDLSTQVSTILTKVNEGQGTLGKLLNDPGVYNHANDTIAKVDDLVAGIQRGEGTAGKLLKSDELYNRVNASIGDAQNVIAAVRGGQGTLGKLVYDPAMYDNTKKLMDNGNALLADVRAGKGTLGKLTTDDALYANLKDASANFREATAKMNANEGTIGKFFGDPAFYDNFSGPGRRYAPDGQRFPPEPEEIPPREAGNFLRGFCSINLKTGRLWLFPGSGPRSRKYPRKIVALPGFAFSDRTIQLRPPRRVRQLPRGNQLPFHREAGCTLLSRSRFPRGCVHASVCSRCIHVPERELLSPGTCNRTRSSLRPCHTRVRCARMRSSCKASPAAF